MTFKHGDPKVIRRTNLDATVHWRWVIEEFFPSVADAASAGHGRPDPDLVQALTYTPHVRAESGGVWVMRQSAGRLETRMEAVAAAMAGHRSRILRLRDVFTDDIIMGDLLTPSILSQQPPTSYALTQTPVGGPMTSARKSAL